MAVVAISDSILTDIADAIRSKNGTENTYKPSQMPDAIEAISGGGITPTGTINITENGTHDVTNYASANVNVPTGSTPVINPLSVTENGTYTAPSGVDGYSPITVNVPQGITPMGTKQISITQNGTTIEDVTNYASAEITVNVSSVPTDFESGIFTPSANVQEIQVPVNGTYTHFAFTVCEAKDDLTLTTNTAILGYVLSNGDGYIMDTSNGTNYSGNWRTNDGWRQYVTFSASSIKAGWLGNGARVYFVAGNTYRWIAW